MEQDAHQQQTQPKYDTAGPEANPGHIDEDSHHCDISALQELPTILNSSEDFRAGHRINCKVWAV